MANYSSDRFMEELMRISSNFIWKNPELALNGDENVSSIEVEQYILAVRGTLTFELIHKFDIDVLTKFGFTEDEAKRIQYSPYTIPESLRPAIEAAQIEYIQKNYKEKSIVKIPLTENLSKEGYSFLGWNTQKDGSGEMYQANQSFVMPAHNVKLYAIWQKDSQKVSLQQTNQKAHIVQTSDHFDLSVILLFLLSIWSLLVIKNLNKKR